MLIIPIIYGNLELISALNGGVTPGLEEDFVPTYFVMEGGEVNRIINDAELNEIKNEKTVKTTMRKVLFAS